MVWWMWVLVGLALLALEILTPGGFYVLFFGLSAVAVGVLTVAGLAGPEWSQWLVFSAFSIASLALFRKPLMEKLALDRDPAGHQPGSMVGETAVLLGDLASGGVAKAEFRGSAWTVRGREGLALPAGSRCVVEHVEGLTLWVKREEGGRADA
jgi:membrane protein implicated in regulation of membrane protease activity